MSNTIEENYPYQLEVTRTNDGFVHSTHLIGSDIEPVRLGVDPADGNNDWVERIYWLVVQYSRPIIVVEERARHEGGQYDDWKAFNCGCLSVDMLDIEKLD